MLKIIGETHPGRVRSMNQDVFYYEVLGDNFAYAIVCDGMGGARAGDVASKVSCDMISAYFARDLKPGMNSMSIKSVMLSAVSAANAKVFSMAKENIEYSGMGTTVVAAVLDGNDLHIVNVGDSRLYVSDENNAQQVTSDHTYTQHMLELGKITPEEALTHNKRHQLTRAIGVGDMLNIDYQIMQIENNKNVLLCSDGFSNYINSNEVLAELLSKAVKNKNTKHLIDYANNKGGSDNITAVIIYRS